MTTILVDGTQEGNAAKGNMEASIKAFEPNARIINANELHTAANGAQEIILMISEAALSPDDIQALINTSRQAGSIAIMGSQSLDQSGVGNLVHLAAYELGLPAAIAIPKAQWNEMQIVADDSVARTAALALSAAFLNNMEIQSVHPESSYSITSGSRAEMLRAIIESQNIEDIFPDHAWDSHQEESLAACYHTLAAIFIRLGDFSTAEECLSQSETFEDSPRALALKGIISKLHGETLGAVASMVSSLQQYEQRKKEDKVHYLTFKPTDIEKINYRLKEGLEALNKRDNEGALSKFTEAVFDFDSFYSDMGLDKIN